MKKTLLMIAIFTGLFFGGIPLLSSGITIKKSYQNSFFKYLVKAQNNLQTQQIIKSESFGGGWERVARDGFDDLNNDYAWAMSTYTDPEGTEWLYVGTLNATPYGSEAKVYRSPDGENWEFVTSFPGCDGVRGATEYAGLLWLGTLSSQQGCQIWVTDGTEWVKANQNGFSIGARSTRGITEYRGKLYADAGQLVNGESAHIFRYEENIEEGNLNSIDPNLWEDITPDWDNPVNSISEMVEFQGDLYVGTFDRSVVGGAFSGLGCEVWQYDGDGTGSWKRVNEPGFGNPKNGAILCMTVFKNKLYAGTQNFIIPEEGGEIGDIQELADGAEVWRWDGESWECVVPYGNPGGGDERIDNMYIWRMIEYNGELVIGTMNLLQGGELWASKTGDTGSFVLINDPGMRLDTKHIPVCFEVNGIPYKTNLSEQYGIRSVAKFKDKLYVGTATWAYFVDRIFFSPQGLNLACPDAPEGTYPYSPHVGCEIWRIEKLPQKYLPLLIYPNPCNLSTNQEITIDRLPPGATVFIYTISGEFVRCLKPQWPSPEKVRWDCRNERGETVARGIYIVFVKSYTETRTGKIAIIK